MATIIKAIMRSYKYYNYDVADPRTEDWFLIRTPWAGLTLLGFYLYFVNDLGPRLMENRKPFKLDRIMQIYNVIQIALNGYLVYKALTLAWLRGYSFKCEPVDYSNNPRALEIARTVYIYFALKMLDLLDTVFFVLRKKQNQVSFLHVYHHVGMVMGGWGGVKYLAGGHVTFLGLINSFVHVVMYSHYLATSLKIGKPWWKKHITQLQLFQFAMILYHFCQLIWEDCGFPLWPAAIFVPQNLFMIIMFSDFYYKAYIKQREPTQNGVKKEMNGTKNGTMNGTNGTMNGTKNGTVNGTMNGTTNGTVNRLANDKINGKANGISGENKSTGNGMSNGIVNGITNGSVNVMANGNSNGTANGKFKKL